MNALNGPRSNGKTADREGDLQTIADKLYALRPDAFAAARDDEVAKARANGRQPLARELSRLRRPTQSAWLVNLLWRDQREAMEKLLALADDLSRAQAEASVPELHRLTDQRRKLETTLIRRARALAGRAGATVTASLEREVQETLAAALARPDVAAEVRTGRLVKPASYAGFGTLPLAAPPAGAQGRHQADDVAAKRSPPSRASTTDHDDGRGADRARERREEAEGRVRDARAALDAAARALDEHGRAVEVASQHHQELRDQAEQLQQQLRELRTEALAAERAALAAERRRDQAEKEHEAALRALERAEQSLTDS